MLCSACRRAGRHVPSTGRLSRTLASCQPVTWSRASLSSLSSSSRPSQSWTPLLSVTLPPRRCYSATADAPAASDATTTALPPKPDFLDAAESHVWDLLCDAFAPVELSVRDISGGCGSMYGIEISSEKFRGANMLKQQRMVNAALGDLMKTWHGVQLKTRVP